MVRRVRKSAPASSAGGQHIVKSISLSNVNMTAVTEDERETAAEAVITAGESADPAPASTDPAHFQEVQIKVEDNGNGTLSASCDTLPRTLSRTKSISRSLVPKMRKLFEKSRSADPEMPQVKILINSEPNTGNGSSSSRVPRITDGTESARSSFVLLGPGDAESREDSNYSISGSSLSLEDDEEKLGRSDSGKQRGFVNKCVTKVKSFMGKSQEL